jgi:hypothetical protein
MKTLLAKLVKLLNRIKSYLPTPLPKGVSEFTVWSNSIIEQAGAPNNDSVKFALATMVLHLSTEQDAYPKEKLAKRLRKAMANQVVSQVINDLKDKQAAEQKALLDKQQADQLEAAKKDTAAPVENPVPDGSKV